MYPEKVWRERRHPETSHDDDFRGDYRKDYSRVVHSAALRRLQSKTQVLGLGESDFYRTRLTHSLEVAQIGVGILIEIKRRFKDSDVIEYLPDERLLEAICLSHDYGHPPFGHGGERALNFAMRNDGGFEGNGQTLRILSKLEKYSANHGLNPTRRVLLGILKYPATYSRTTTNNFNKGSEITQYTDKELKPPKCFYDCDLDVVKWTIQPFSFNDKSKFTSVDQKNKTQFKSLDCTLMDLADEISYSVHDLEDAIKLSLINREMWNRYIKSSDYSGSIRIEIEKWERRIFSSSENEMKQGISNMVYFFIHAIRLEVKEEFEHPLLKYGFKIDKEYRKIRESIQNLVMTEVVKSHRVRILESKGQKIVFEIFKELLRDPESYLPPSTLKKYKESSEDMKTRVVCDYVSGMTDEYASRLYQRLFLPKFGSLFDL